MAGSPPVQFATKLVSVIDVMLRESGFVGGGIKVFMLTPADVVGFVELMAVTMSVYVVEAVRPVNVAVCEERPLSVDGVTDAPLSVYV